MLPNITHYQEAASHGDPEAQYKLAISFAIGISVSQNYAEAIKWLQKASDQNYGKALYSLGKSYALGAGVNRCYETAITLYLKAANKGIAEAQYNLAYCYANGRGIPQDYLTACMWANIANLNGITVAKSLQDKFKLHLSEEEMEKAQRLAEEWMANRRTE